MATQQGGWIKMIKMDKIYSLVAVIIYLQPCLGLRLSQWLQSWLSPDQFHDLLALSKPSLSRPELYCLVGSCSVFSEALAALPFSQEQELPSLCLLLNYPGQLRNLFWHKPLPVVGLSPIKHRKLQYNYL